MVMFSAMPKRQQYDLENHVKKRCSRLAGSIGRERSRVRSRTLRRSEALGDASPSASEEAPAPRFFVSSPVTNPIEGNGNTTINNMTDDLSPRSPHIIVLLDGFLPVANTMYYVLL